MTKRKDWTRSYRKWKLRDGMEVHSGHRKIYRAKRNKELKQQQHNKKIMNLLTDQMAKDEFEKAEYQRTGIQH